MADVATKRGVLIDFDLARIQRDDPSATGRERTGTVPFMAVDFLTQKYLAGQIAHLYRHDLESCIWVLGYTLLSDAVPDVKAWDTGHFKQCRNNKLAFLMDLMRHSASGAKKSMWEMFGNHALHWLKKLLQRVDDAAYQRATRNTQYEGTHDELSSEDERVLERWMSSTLEAASAIIQDFEKFMHSKLAHLGFAPLTQDQLSASS
ncbi:uncharacterized protein FIBRA_08993 [Fibroporia radiculosa]|uniref:Fungal-type protein kinase domain-containing protein n=1 Tax=Fibroporia radiculosa TaxID=599839 RepID=J4H5G6_9APHY|nr:uncharacterized protein FIBRA_08993 [Fibroporia radiculosa]CCM06704.1 predicted protein [Fibroporia radiculosa]